MYISMSALNTDGWKRNIMLYVSQFQMAGMQSDEIV